MTPPTANATKRPSRTTPRKSAVRSTKRLITPADLTRFQLLGDPQLSPDGEYVLFTHKRVGEKNEYATNLWIAPTKARRAGARSAPQRAGQFTGGGKDSHGRWSPDGSYIAFISQREKHKPQIYLINADGGEAKRLTNFPEGSIASFKWSPTGGYLAVSFRQQHPDWTQAAKKQREENGLTTPPRIIDEWWHRLDGDGYFGDKRHSLYLVDVESGEHERIYDKDAAGNFSFDFSPDGSTIALITIRDKRWLVKEWKCEVLLLNVKTKKLRKLPNIPEGPKTQVLWSPDGKYLCWAGRKGREGVYGTRNLELWVSDAKKGGARSLTDKEDFCLMAITLSDSAEAAFDPVMRWHPDSRRVLMQIGWHGEAHIASVPVTGGKIKFHTSGKFIHQLGNVSADGKKVAMTIASDRLLDEVHVATVTSGAMKPKTITNLNKPLFDELDLAPMREHWITSEDGNKVHVWTLLPPKHKKNGKLPAVLQIHGGPHTQYGVGFFHEMQALAAAGYLVVMSNPRGSKGYGEVHCDAIRGSWGDKDWIDIQAIKKFMEEHPRIDTKRMGVMGGSYGGYMTNWVIGHTRDFKAAITDRCVSNLVSMYGNSDFPMRPDEYWPGNNWDRPEALWKHSPIQYMGKVRTPTLIIHSEGDLRCNIEQAEQVFTLLKHHNVPCRFVRYPQETSHGMSRKGPPDMRLHRLAQILEWWTKYLK
jgi:dipeptidyl aminopeptidase/acylaminoacyl peptidase